MSHVKGVRRSVLGSTYLGAGQPNHQKMLNQIYFYRSSLTTSRMCDWMYESSFYLSFFFTSLLQILAAFGSLSADRDAISDKIRISCCRWCVAWKRSLTSLADVFGQGHVFVATRLLKTEMPASTQIAYSQVRNKPKVEDWSVIQHHGHGHRSFSLQTYTVATK